jgi:hypothetical protein
LEKSMLRLLRRQGVPVLKRWTSKPSWRRLSERVEMLSPMRPPAWFCWPTWSRPRMKVPEEMTTALAR